MEVKGCVFILLTYFYSISGILAHPCSNQIQIPTLHPGNTNLFPVPLGHRHRVFCDFGFYDPIRRPIIYAICGSDGNWHVDAPCKPKQCSNPNPILGGIVSLPSGSNNVGASTAEVICNEGFEWNTEVKNVNGILTCVIVQPNTTQWIPDKLDCVPTGSTSQTCHQICTEVCN